MWAACELCNGTLIIIIIYIFIRINCRFENKKFKIKQMEKIHTESKSTMV